MENLPALLLGLVVILGLRIQVIAFISCNFIQGLIERLRPPFIVESRLLFAERVGLFVVESV